MNPGPLDLKSTALPMTPCTQRKCKNIPKKFEGTYRKLSGRTPENCGPFTSSLNIIYKKLSQKTLSANKSFVSVPCLFCFYLTNLVQFKKWEKRQKELKKMRVRAEKQLRLYFVHENKLMPLHFRSSL